MVKLIPLRKVKIKIEKAKRKKQPRRFNTRAYNLMRKAGVYKRKRGSKRHK